MVTVGYCEAARAITSIIKSNEIGSAVFIHLIAVFIIVSLILEV